MKELKDLLLLHEGLRLKPYRCPAGKLTIGVGRNLEDIGITWEEASYLLEKDIERVTKEATASFPWFHALSERRKMVILSMLFNLGMGRFVGFRKFTKALEEKDYKKAAREMMHSKWAEQVGERAKYLSDIMLNDA